jgi:hypothetical protein
MERNSMSQQSSSVFGGKNTPQPPVATDADPISSMDFDSTTQPITQPKKRLWIILTAITFSLDCTLGFGIWLTNRSLAVPVNPLSDESLNQSPDDSPTDQGASGGAAQSVESLAEQIRNVLGGGAIV